MHTSGTFEKIPAALLAAQKEIGAAVKGASNPFFHSKYADLGSIMEACKEALNKNGISVLQPVGADDMGFPYVETIILHESGEFISDKMKLVVKEENNPQAMGSAISYARRYALQSMLFIPAEDDDGETATSHSEPVQTPSIAPRKQCELCGAYGGWHKATCPNKSSEVGYKHSTASQEEKDPDWINEKLA